MNSDYDKDYTIENQKKALENVKEALENVTEENMDLKTALKVLIKLWP